MEDVLTVQFDDTGLADQYLESIELSSPTRRGIRIFDGRKAAGEKYFDHTNVVSFQVGDLRPGIYYLTVQMAGNKFSRTMVKK